VIKKLTPLKYVTYTQISQSRSSNISIKMRLFDELNLINYYIAVAALL